MNHTVLARKWRPKKFADLVGQQTSVTVLKNIIESNRLHHAYLLTGTRGVGKTTIARIIAKALNCLALNGVEPCGTCSNCVQIDSGRFIDVIEIDAASNTGVDNIRELLDNAQYAPTSGKYKVYIIDEVHMLSKSAFNAMLKTLEEPPSHVIFILATTDPQKVPITVLSRCLQLKLCNLSIPEITEYLATVLNLENLKFEKPAIEIIAKVAKGSMRDALSLLDQAIAFANGSVTEMIVRQMLGISDDTYLFELLDAISNADSQRLVNTAQNIYKEGHDLENILHSLSQKLCDLSLTQLTTIQFDEKTSHYAAKISVNDVQLYFEIANLGLEQITKINEKYPIFIMTLLRMLAFNIGSDEKKQVVLTQNNFKVDFEKPVENSKTTTIIENQPIESNLIVSKEIILDEKTNTARNNFDGNWLNLVQELKPQLGSTLFPFVENAKLETYSQDSFCITIDERYQVSFSDPLKINLKNTLSKHFERNIQITVTFSSNVNNTLKEINNLKQEQKQQLAEESITNDPKLNEILTNFSAKIIPGSIKPIT